MNKILLKPSARLWVIFLAIVNVILHLVAYNHLEYHRDELLYFSLSLHPDFGYASVPPLTGWLAWLMKTALGYTLFSIKLLPAVFSGLFVILISRMTAALGGKDYAQILAAVAAICTPVTLRVFHLYQPVFIDLFCWTLVYYIIILYLNTEQDKYLIRLGLVMGIGILNKYLIILLIPALLFSLVWTPWRNVFLKRSLYLGAVLCLLIVLPNMIWQIAHHLPVVRHMQQLNENQLVHVERMDFLKDQLLMPFAGLLVILPGLYFLIKDSRYRAIGYSVFIVIFALLILRGKSYYTIGVFPVLIAAGAVYWEKFLSRPVPRRLLPLLIAGLTIPILPLGLPILSQQGMINYFKNLELNYGLILDRKFEDGTIHSLPQDYADQLGWEELAKITDKAYQLIPDKSKAIIYAENYGQAGAVSIIGKKYGLPEAISFSDSYRYWAPRHFNPDIEYLIYINDVMGEDVQSLFQDIKIIGSITNRDAREFDTKVYLCASPVHSFNTLWSNALKRIESE